MNSQSFLIASAYTDVYSIQTCFGKSWTDLDWRSSLKIVSKDVSEKKTEDVVRKNENYMTILLFQHC